MGSIPVPHDHVPNGLDQIGEVIEQRFAEFWPYFLLFNIQRTRMINEEIGNPIDGMIMQVISWHQLLLSIGDNGADGEQNFSDIWNSWHGDPDSRLPSQKKISVVGISQLTALPFETVRRRVKNLVNNGWLEIDPDTGYRINIDSDANHKITNVIHSMEKQELIRLLGRFFTAWKHTHQ